MNLVFNNSDQLKTTFRSINANWVMSVSHKVCILLFLASLAAILLRWNRLPPEVPLWYAKPWGVERLAHPLFLFLLPTGIVFWHGINIIVSLFVTRDYLVFSQLLFIASMLVSILSFLTLMKIIIIVS